MADYDVQGARKAGYTDSEIADYLSKTGRNVAKVFFDTAKTIKDVPKGLAIAAGAVQAVSGGDLRKAAPVEPMTGNDFLRTVSSGLAQAQGYYRGYIQPKIDSLVRRLTP